jgi:hypothetical protein
MKLQQFLFSSVVLLSSITPSLARPVAEPALIDPEMIAMLKGQLTQMKGTEIVGEDLVQLEEILGKLDRDLKKAEQGLLAPADPPAAAQTPAADQVPAADPPATNPPAADKAPASQIPGDQRPADQRVGPTGAPVPIAKMADTVKPAAAPSAGPPPAKSISLPQSKGKVPDPAPGLQDRAKAFAANAYQMKDEQTFEQHPEMALLSEPPFPPQ